MEMLNRRNVEKLKFLCVLCDLCASSSSRTSVLRSDDVASSLRLLIRHSLVRYSEFLNQLIKGGATDSQLD